MRNMGFVDIHSHILPGLDDGAESMTETLGMLRLASREGITHIIATPHYKAGRYPADAERLCAVLERVRRRAEEEEIPVALYAGNEIFYHSELEDRLDRGRLCTLNGTAYVLIEFSPLTEYVYLRNAAESLLGMGYLPVLAHVERCQCLYRDEECVAELRTLGCGIQVNTDSILCRNGWKTGIFVHRLLKNQLVDYLGTDAHNITDRRPVMAKCADLLHARYGSDYADRVLYGNAADNFGLR